MPAPAPTGFFSGGSATTASVVRMFFAIDAAFCSAERVTIAGSMTPADTRSTISPVWALRPSPAGDLRFATSVETHGLDCGPYETFNEEFIVCRECGWRYVCEWDGTQELREISIPSDRIETAAVRLNQLPAA